MTPPVVPVALEGIKVTLIDALLIHHHTTKPCVACLGDVNGIAAVLAPVVAGAVEAALTDAADAVRNCRENGMPPGFLSHPYHEGFEKWLRNRAASIVREGGQPS